MTKTVRVTSAQVSAANLKIKRSVASGKYVSPGIQAIANAKPAASLNGTAAAATQAARERDATFWPCECCRRWASFIASRTARRITQYNAKRPKTKGTTSERISIPFSITPR